MCFLVLFCYYQSVGGLLSNWEVVFQTQLPKNRYKFTWTEPSAVSTCGDFWVFLQPFWIQGWNQAVCPQTLPFTSLGVQRDISSCLSATRELGSGQLNVRCSGACSSTAGGWSGVVVTLGWSVTLRVAWTVVSTGNKNMHTDVSWIPLNVTVTRMTRFSGGSLPTQAQGTQECLKWMENLKLWPDLQIFLILIQSSIHRIQRNPKTTSKNSPRISFLSPSQMLLIKNKRTTGKNGDTVTFCLVSFTTQMHGYILLLLHPCFLLESY